MTRDEHHDQPATAPDRADDDGAVEHLDHGLTVVDTHTAGIARVTAGYLIAAPRPCLVECGPALSIDAVIASLHRLGLDAADLAWLVVSHVHLDHAGGAGDLLAAFPSAKVVVSEVGARHLVDPERLNASSRRVYGDLMDTVYGDCTPVDADRLVAVADGDVLELGGGRRLDLLYTPGHAKHHIAAVDSDSGALFVGDSVGVRLPGMTQIRPATPPPDFDLELAFDTLARYRALQPSRVHLAHYGAVDPPDEALAEASDRLRAWADVAEEAWQEHDEVEHVADTLGARVAETVAAEDAEDERRIALLAGTRSNAAGLTRYFRQRAAG